MAQKRKVVKRVYEKGRETTLSAKKRAAVNGSSTPKAKEAKDSSIERIKSRTLVGSGAEKTKNNPRFADSTINKNSNVQHSENNFFPENDYLPPNYGVTRCVLLVRDPYWIYAYWEVAEEHIDKIKKNIPEDQVSSAKFVLRIYDITLVDFNGSNANFSFDIEPTTYTNSWHIKLFHDCGSFVGEIGLKTSDGKFFALIRSNYVQTPRVSYSPRSEQIWMEVTDSDHSSPFVFPKKVANEPNSEEQTAKRTQYPTNIRKQKRLYVSEEELRRYYSRLSPLLRNIIESRLESSYPNEAKKYSIIIEGDSDFDRQKMLSQLPKDYFIKEVLLGASEGLVSLGEGASEQRVSGSSVSSDFVSEKVKSRNFFFELNTELIVYGRTEPDAEVWLADKRISLRGDGTFSLRFSLPDGKVPLEFKAISNDKIDSKRIYTYVERNTDYEPEKK